MFGEKYYILVWRVVEMRKSWNEHESLLLLSTRKNGFMPDNYMTYKNSLLLFL